MSYQSDLPCQSLLIIISIRLTCQSLSITIISIRPTLSVPYHYHLYRTYLSVLYLSLSSLSDLPVSPLPIIIISIRLTCQSFTYHYHLYQTYLSVLYLSLSSLSDLPVSPSLSLSYQSDLPCQTLIIVISIRLTCQSFTYHYQLYQSYLSVLVYHYHINQTYRVSPLSLSSLSDLPVSPLPIIIISIRLTCQSFTYHYHLYQSYLSVLVYHYHINQTYLVSPLSLSSLSDLPVSPLPIIICIRLTCQS